MKSAKLLMIASALLIIALMPGCALEKPDRVYTYDTKSGDRFEEFYIEKTEYYSDKAVICWKGTIDAPDDIEPEAGWKISGHKAVYETDKPTEMTAFSFSDKQGDITYYFRYLDSDSYACIRQVMDSEGGILTEGDTDRYYTEEEKRKKREAAEQFENGLEEQFLRFEGKWTGDDGDYFTFFREDGAYAVSYSFDGESGTETPIFISDYLYAVKNCIQVSYIDGPLANYFELELSEDEQSFTYKGKDFFREQ